MNSYWQEERRVFWISVREIGEGKPVWPAFHTHTHVQLVKRASRPMRNVVECAPSDRDQNLMNIFFFSKENVKRRGLMFNVINRNCWEWQLFEKKNSFVELFWIEWKQLSPSNSRTSAVVFFKSFVLLLEWVSPTGEQRAKQQTAKQTIQCLILESVELRCFLFFFLSFSLFRLLV